MNWLDYVLILIFVLNIISGLQAGFIAGATELLSLVISLIIAVVAYPFLAGIFRTMGFSGNMAQFLGFSLVFVFFQIVFAAATMPLTKRLKRRIKDTIAGNLNKWLGPVPYFVMFFISTSFILAVFIVFPVFSPIRSAIINSRFGLELAEPAVTILQPVSVEFKHEIKSSAI